MATNREYDEVVVKIADMTRALMRHPDFYKVQALATRKRFDALVEVGFSESQAVQIVAAQGVGVEAKGNY